MKQLIEKFKKDNPIPNIYISYGKMWDLDVDVETLGNNVIFDFINKENVQIRKKNRILCLYFWH